MHPLWIAIAPSWLNPHLFFEGFAWLAALGMFVAARRQAPIEGVSVVDAGWVRVGAVIGALVGAKLLFLLENPAELLSVGGWIRVLVGGKTIVGGLLGGWIGVEVTKHRVGVRTSTGDAYVGSIAVGTMIGRLGCFFAGTTDGTHGVPTNGPLGLELGDGISRYPTALFEVVIVGVIWAVVRGLAIRRPGPSGANFRRYMVGYLVWRLAVEFIKTTPRPYLGVSAIQIAATVGLAYLVWETSKRRRASGYRSA